MVVFAGKGCLATTAEPRFCTLGVASVGPGSLYTEAARKLRSETETETKEIEGGRVGG